MMPLGLSINIFEPLVQGNAFVESIDRPSSYTHTIQAVGGYWSADISAVGDLSLMDEQIEEGLGRHIEVRNDALEICWQGFVNQVDANFGALSVTRGPLLDVANRVKVVYAGVDTTTLPPTTGVQTETADADHAASQALYGIIPRILTPGGVSATDAVQIRDTFLAENALPTTTHDFTTGAASAPSLTLRCLGYVHWLTLWPYNQTATVGTVNASDKITTVLAAEPNVFLAWDTAHVDANTLQVYQYEYENLLAWDILQDTALRGDAANARWLIGVYNDLEMWYHVAPSTVEYTLALSDPAQRIMGAGAEIQYYDVRPGRWLMFTDFLPSRIVSATLREDPRAMFIESATFTAPNTLTLAGGKYETLSQVLAAKGLGGIGA